MLTTKSPLMLCLVAILIATPVLSGCGDKSKTTTTTVTTETVTQAVETPVADEAAPQVTRFADLTDVETAEIIEELHQLGAFDGIIDGPNFEPYKPITRGEYVTWLFKAYNVIQPPADRIRLTPQKPPYFTDLPASHSAYKYAQALASAGYSIGFDDKTFKPDQPLKREELIAIKVGLDQGKAVPPEPTMNGATWNFGDFKQIDPKYTGYIYADHFKYNNGSTAKYSNSNIIRTFGKLGSLKPKEPVLRHEAAASLWQVDEYGSATTTNALARIAEEKAKAAAQ